MKRQQGFGLIELMAVLGIIAVLMVFALPLYDAWVQKTESQSVAAGLQQAIRHAKIDAALYQKDAVVCLINAQGDCDRLGQAGVMVFVDKNFNNRPDAADVISLKQAWTLRFGTVSLKSSLARHYIKFMGDNAKPRGHIGSFYYCTNQDMALSHQTVVNMYGLVSSKQGDVYRLDC